MKLLELKEKKMFHTLIKNPRINYSDLFIASFEIRPYRKIHGFICSKLNVIQN